MIVSCFTQTSFYTIPVYSYNSPMFTTNSIYQLLLYYIFINKTWQYMYSTIVQYIPVARKE